ncbi:MAG: metallophosphoesterase [Deltaproteobacteria bacterium]|jgi:predicted MPP superfamily phosphohydrolase|nr:metallophosphoesterase [Deltaproteobacteria bacterium]
MVLKTVLFLAAILALTIGAHLLFYKAVVRLFIIDSPGLKAALFVILFFLSLSFMASFFLLQWQENSITIGYYIFAASWNALFLNLLLAALLSWIIIAAIWLAGTYPNTRLIAAGCLTLAVLLTAYGMWNAFHPGIKKLEIELKNLPDQWKDKTIVQLSDVHLGHFYGTTFLKDLVGSVNALNPELIFITGDLFDGMAKNISHFADELNRFEAGKGVYFITGNHETYIGVNRAFNVLSQTHIKILKNEVIDINGLQVIGISYPGIKGTDDIYGLEKMKQNSVANKPRILLFHTPTNISPKENGGLDRHFDTYWIPDTTFSLVQELRVDLQLSGHTHAGQIFPFGYLTKLIYKDYDYGLRRLSNFAIYTTSGVGTWGPPMRTGNSPEIVVIKLK